VGRFLVPAAFLALLFSGAAFANSTFPACASDNLANYIADTVNTATVNDGCAVGVLDYINFAYIPGTNAPSASAIEVNPITGGFSFGPASAGINQTVTFEIDYSMVIDPAPIVTGDNLHIDPPSGDVFVTEYFCNDTSYIGSGLCSAHVPAQSATVGTPASGFPDTVPVTFNPPVTTSQEVGIVFTLIGSSTAGASFDGLDSGSIVSITPEPASAAAFLVGFLALAGGYKLKKQRTR
jgi:hypothetical protein